MLGQLLDIAEQRFAEAIVTIIDLLPRLILGILILAVAFGVAGTIAGTVRSGLSQTGLFDAVSQTPIAGNASANNIAAGTGILISGYVKLIGAAIAVAALEIGGISGLAVSVGWYVTFALGAAAVVAIGSVLATVVGGRAAAWEPVRGTAAAPILGGLTQAFLYLVAGVIALDLLDLRTGIVFAVVEPLARGLGLALAVGLGAAIVIAYSDDIAAYLDNIGS
ncbi:uncharacterized protein NP_0234A [Natronomonas pharaonis DSM 2160]|uniref:Uncharacterized protein n=1 Tax=Natronomonas pharaonis (strain ATCC 35678 / DSM 2160 / CIP 103997 / JCM 8858 / NBRC 14720 / NCIMB 2260 / Gabara) TaxID=348780 RepID=A0A1U7ETH6_NATPD|nr:hypothetical protein [Natronomonas pharaonis]CAI48208.1 uncharacterized protein NP_0234A [Natronomonas pharaonis DSM 2160]